MGVKEVKKVVLELANKAYPKEIYKDMDGDWYDTNEYKRMAYAEGLIRGLELASEIRENGKIS